MAILLLSLVCTTDNGQSERPGLTDGHVHCSKLHIDAPLRLVLGYRGVDLQCVDAYNAKGVELTIQCHRIPAATRNPAVILRLAIMGYVAVKLHHLLLLYRRRPLLRWVVHPKLDKMVPRRGQRHRLGPMLVEEQRRKRASEANSRF